MTVSDYVSIPFKLNKIPDSLLPSYQTDVIKDLVFIPVSTANTNKLVL